MSPSDEMRSLRIRRLLVAGTFAVVGLLLLGGTAQAQCLSVSVAGVAGPAIFADGFESADTAAWSAPVTPAYSTRATEDLGVVVDLDPSLVGDHLVELRWSLGTGQLYQSVAVPVTVAAAGRAAATTRSVAGYPFPVAVSRAVAVTRGESPALAVSSSLPVAGTSIVDAALWGEWQVAAFVDGAEQPCAAPAIFRLEP